MPTNNTIDRTEVGPHRVGTLDVYAEQDNSHDKVSIHSAEPGRLAMNISAGREDVPFVGQVRRLDLHVWQRDASVADVNLRLDTNHRPTVTMRVSVRQPDGITDVVLHLPANVIDPLASALNEYRLKNS